MTTSSFAARIRERYPQGLTGIFAIGGTRTTYILENNRHNADPGQISDFKAYAGFILGRYLALMEAYLDLGGQNMIIPVLSYQSFHERGEEYARLVANYCLGLIGEQMVAFYQSHEVDPYFAGIDTLLQLPVSHPAHALAATLQAHQQAWPFREGRRKVIWEIAPIPLYSFWRAHAVMGEAAQAGLNNTLMAGTDLQTLHDTLYHYYAQAAYGTDLPVPHFYLGSNRNGDLKLRAMLPITLLCGDPFRMFFTPYPSLFTTRDTLQAILEDLAFGSALRSTRKDYSAQYTSELAEAEYARILSLANDPRSTLGMTRQASTVEDEM